jgi:hypothetical protein
MTAILTAVACNKRVYKQAVGKLLEKAAGKSRLEKAVGAPVPGSTRGPRPP